MKKLFVAVLFFSSFQSNAQTDTSAFQFAKFFDSTGFGTPDGKLVNKEIGSAGGKIVSDDNRVELIFPAGALTSNTTISIQPVTNLAPNGVGKSYWFEPSGIQFKKPVQIIFHYTDEEAEICPPDWMSLGVQSKNGKWSFVDYESFDSISKTLTGFIHHFSGASNINDVQLKPNKTKLPVDGVTSIDVIDISSISSSYSWEPAELPGANNLLWYASGVLNGNERTGKIGTSNIPSGNNRLWQAYYLAPRFLPQKNPVKISVEIYRKKGRGLRKTITCYILVYDMYKISVIHEIKGDDFGIKEFLGGGELIDSASCIVKVYPHEIRISDIQNYEPAITKTPGVEHGGTLELKIFTAGTQGSIHLTTDYSSFRLSGDYPPEVYYKLPLRNIPGFRVQYVGRRFTGPVQTLPYPSLPTEIEFIANGRQQQYNVTIAGVDSHKLIVTPYREERRR